MNWLDVVILGIVEGITEFLPISSTGHLILTDSLLRMPQSEFLKTFEIAIQLGAIMSVAVLYWKTLIFDRQMLKKIAVAFVPTAVIGLIFYRFMRSFLLGNETLVIWSLLLGGIFIIVFELWYKRKTVSQKETQVVSYKQAFLIGLVQTIAMVPGVSRSAATVIGGLAIGLNRKTIVEFSFLLAIPTMVAVVGFDLFKHTGSFTQSQFGYLIGGFVASFIAAMAAIKFLLSFIRNNSFIPFGIYRIILALLFLSKYFI